MSGVTPGGNPVCIHCGEVYGPGQRGTHGCLILTEDEQARVENQWFEDDPKEFMVALVEDIIAERLAPLRALALDFQNYAESDRAQATSNPHDPDAPYWEGCADANAGRADDLRVTLERSGQA